MPGAIVVSTVEARRKMVGSGPSYGATRCEREALSVGAVHPHLWHQIGCHHNLVESGEAMLLREFLYVDADKVRGLLAQLDEGIVEGSSLVERSEKSTGGGFKGLAEHSQRWGSERTEQKSQGDALFPSLEGALESLGMLRDISEELSQVEFWDLGSMQAKFPPGSLVRITAPSCLFDARYIASILNAFATTWRGLINTGSVVAIKAPQTPLKKGQQGSQVSRRAQEPGTQDLEDSIPDEGILYGGSDQSDSVSRELLRGIIQISRAVFTPGLHLNMRPTGNSTHVVTARLQEGRQFLDGETDILFARYGGGFQEWTMVGSLGHYGELVGGDIAAGLELVDSAGRINRSVFAEMVNKYSQLLGSLGFVDLPQAPGFSVVPLAIYRTIGINNPQSEQPRDEIES